ncbi:MAG TPA: hypothetical protein VLK29_00535 [Luteimonas sp.]|nr:hypothetical protein [Luteimonas sp.]
MVMLRGSTNNYQLTEHDVDLQDNPPCSDAQCRLQGKEGKARQMALTRIKQATGLALTLDQFTVTQTAMGDTGPATPVEWQYRTSVGNGDRRRNWTVIIDMDSVAPGQPGNGPDRSHVGYSYWCDGYDPVGRVNGHVFIEYVSASRPA